MTDLVRRSIEVIRAGQAASGAYVASPTFAEYRYCWLRDGSFIADAMSRVGEVESAEAFFDWCAHVVRAHYPDLHARYELDGSATSADWPLHQLDGYGTWIWAAHEHAARHGRATDRWDDALEFTTRYLADNWRRPTTDWWEEREGLHAATLACVHAGLAAREHPDTAAARAAALAHVDDRLDASLLCLYEPFRLLDPVSNGLLLTRIAERLTDPDGGVHRHLDDEYYGGGAWIILTAWLGWARRDPAALEWIEARATPEGHLPEQVAEHLLQPDRLQAWNENWGRSACPLLWSHAMYLTLWAEIVAD